MGCHSSSSASISSSEQTYRYICNTPFFTALDEHHLREFARYWKIERYGAGAEVFRQGSRAEKMYIVGEGAVDVDVTGEDADDDFNLTPSHIAGAHAAQAHEREREATGADEKERSPSHNHQQQHDEKEKLKKKGHTLDDELTSALPTGPGPGPGSASAPPKPGHRGSMSLSVSQSQATKRLLCQKTSGAFFGQEGVFQSTLSGMTRSATVIAATSCVLISLSRMDMSKYLAFAREVARDSDLEVIVMNCLGTTIEKNLAELPFLAGVKPRQIRLLATMVRYVPLKEGEVVFEDGAVDPNGNSMYIVHQGSVKATAFKNGVELMLGLIDQGKFFGEIGLMIDMPRTAQIRACEKSLLLELRKADFQNFLAVANTPALKKNIDDLLKRRTAEHFRKYNVPFLQSIPADKYPLLAQLCKIEQLQPGHVVFREGDVGTAFYIIAHGQVRVSVKRQATGNKKHLRAVSTFTGGEFVLSKLLEDQAGTSSGASTPLPPSSSAPFLLGGSSSSSSAATNGSSSTPPATASMPIPSSSSSHSSHSSDSLPASSNLTVSSSSSSISPLRPGHKSTLSSSSQPGHRSTSSGNGLSTLSPYSSHGPISSSSRPPMLLFNSDSQFEGVVLGASSGNGSGSGSVRSDRSPTDTNASIQSRWRVLTEQEAAERKQRNDSLNSNASHTTSSGITSTGGITLSTTASGGNAVTSLTDLVGDGGAGVRLRGSSNGNSNNAATNSGGASGSLARTRGGARIMTITTVKPQSQPSSQIDDSPAIGNGHAGTSSVRALDVPGIDSVTSPGTGKRRSTATATTGGNNGGAARGSAAPRSISFAKDTTGGGGGGHGVASVAEESKDGGSVMTSPSRHITSQSAELQLMSVSRIDTKDFTASTSHMQGGLDTSTDDGEDFIISSLGPGSYFGEASLIQDAPRAATVTVVTRCALLSLTKANFEEFFRACPEAFSNFQVKLARYDVKLHHLLFHPIGMELFTKHLVAEHSEENINFWKQARLFYDHDTMSDDVREKRALGLYEEFISSEAKSQINLRGPTRLKLKAQLYPRTGPIIVTRDMFVNAQNEILALMATDPFRRFKSSPLFQDFLQQTKEPELTMEVPDRDGGSPPLSPVDRRPSNNNNWSTPGSAIPATPSSADSKRRKSSVRTLLSGLTTNLSANSTSSDPVSPRESSNSNGSSSNNNSSTSSAPAGTASVRNRPRTSAMGIDAAANGNANLSSPPQSYANSGATTPTSSNSDGAGLELSPGFSRRMTKRTIINV